MLAMTGEIIEQPRGESRRRGCLFYVKRGLKRFGIVLVTLILLGVSYQTIATEMDKRAYAPRGQLYTVNGHRMHMICMGEGSPAVILQAGGLAESLWWYWVQNQLSEHIHVCAFDRPGFGWSEAVDGPRDALAINAELHALLEQSDIPAPYVMAGHSLGAMWTRVYAAQYPDEVVGIVRLTAQQPRLRRRLPARARLTNRKRRVSRFRLSPGSPTEPDWHACYRRVHSKARGIRRRFRAKWLLCNRPTAYSMSAIPNKFLVCGSPSTLPLPCRTWGICPP